MRKLWMIGLLMGSVPFGCGGDDSPADDGNAGSEEAGDGSAESASGNGDDGGSATNADGGEAGEGDDGQTTASDESGNVEEGGESGNVEEGGSSDGGDGPNTGNVEDGGSTSGDDGQTSGNVSEGSTSGNGDEGPNTTNNSGGTTTEGGGETGNRGSTSGNETDPNPGDDTNGGGLEISALAVPGGLDRIKIFGLDAQAGTCTVVVLVWPGNGNGGEPALPQGWSLESAAVSDDVGDCGVPDPPDLDAEPATSTAGSVMWEGDPLPFPCTIDVDVHLDFAVASPVDLVGADVSVEGC